RLLACGNAKGGLGALIAPHRDNKAHPWFDSICEFVRDSVAVEFIERLDERDGRDRADPQLRRIQEAWRRTVFRHSSSLRSGTAYERLVLRPPFAGGLCFRSSSSSALSLATCSVRVATAVDSDGAGGGPFDPEFGIAPPIPGKSMRTQSKGAVGAR